MRTLSLASRTESATFRCCFKLLWRSLAVYCVVEVESWASELSSGCWKPWTAAMPWGWDDISKSLPASNSGELLLSSFFRLEVILDLDLLSCPSMLFWSLLAVLFLLEAGGWLTGGSRPWDLGSFWAMDRWGLVWGKFWSEDISFKILTN